MAEVRAGGCDCGLAAGVSGEQKLVKVSKEERKLGSGGERRVTGEKSGRTLGLYLCSVFCVGILSADFCNFCLFLRSPCSYCLDLAERVGTGRITLMCKDWEKLKHYKWAIVREEESSAEKRERSKP